MPLLDWLVMVDKTRISDRLELSERFSRTDKPRILLRFVFCPGNGRLPDNRYEGSVNKRTDDDVSAHQEESQSALLYSDREDWPKRTVPLRQRKEVQAMPWVWLYARKPEADGRSTDA